MSTLSKWNRVGAWVAVLMVVGVVDVAAAANKATQVGPRKGPQAPQGGGGPYVCTIGPGILLDNGDTDGTNGYSNAVASVFGFRRTLLDDFVVPAQGFNLDEFTWRHLWNSFPVPSGTGLEMLIRADSAGTPGAVLTTLSPTGYTEVATGRIWFGRPEAESHANLGGANLTAGTYWFEFTIVGPDNNFAMVKATLTGQECWVNYDDFGGLQPGSAIFGVQADLTWALCGTLAPVELMDFAIE
jgi:hypothetical protein